MRTSVVKVPKAQGDLDFLAFSFNGLHSYDDFNIYRVSDGNRYSDNLVPTMSDKTAEISGADGMHYYGTTYKQKDFNISFAFDKMEEDTYRKMKQWLNGKEMGDLWFAEAPYKVYTAKVTGAPNIKSLCFEVDGKREYRGEGSVTFTAYWPFAHTPDSVGTWNEKKKQYEYCNGKLLEAYENFYKPNQWGDIGLGKDEWSLCKGENPGDILTYFTLTINSQDEETIREIHVGGSVITINGKYKNLKWDSKTGIISTTEGSVEKAIPYLGIGVATIPVGGIKKEEIYYTVKEENTSQVKYTIDGLRIFESGYDSTSGYDYLKLNYHYWYY